MFLKVNISQDLQMSLLQEEEKKCREEIERHTWLDNMSCPMEWDGVICWPSISIQQYIELPCPYYVNGMINNTATRYCTVNGTWFAKSDGSWTNYTDCIANHPAPNNTLYLDHIDNMKIVSQIGYSASFITLILASFILSTNKRLRCPRNNLHLHLFLSFIIRSLCYFLKAKFFPFEEVYPQKNELITKYPTTNFCIALTIIWQYSLLANYNWILMEGLYLHNLIFINIFDDKSSIFKYIVIGWCLPIIFIIPWIVIRITYENENCWSINDNPSYFWVIRGPITISIILNFIFFINVTRVLFRKLFSSSNLTPASSSYRYSKWFKSTLVLVPLFGIHYSLFLIALSFSRISTNLEIVWLYTDIFFTSFQGFFVALFYCFLNAEIQQEFNKYWFKYLRPCSSYRLFLTHVLNGFLKNDTNHRKDSKCFSTLKKTDTISSSLNHELNIDTLNCETPDKP